MAGGHCYHGCNRNHNRRIDFYLDFRWCSGSAYRVFVWRTSGLADRGIFCALKKANINPAHVDSEDHMESNMAKGWITAEDVAKAKEIIATVSAEKAAHLPEQMIQNIAKGRLAKFLKEVCLLNQEDIMDAKKTVREVLAAADPELKIVDFKRFTLKAE